MNYFNAKNKAVDTRSMKFSKPGGRVYFSSKKSRAKRANELLKTISRMKVTR